MWKRAALVYMVSPTASTCECYAAKCTKNSPEILRVKRGQKTAKRTQPTPKKGKTGCVLGAGGDGSG